MTKGSKPAFSINFLQIVFKDFFKISFAISSFFERSIFISSKIFESFKKVIPPPKTIPS
jgi:hypothetical protein